PGAVWAIDIGNSSLKALYLSTERGVVEVIGFDKIRHGKILSGSDVTEAEREELVALTLRKFVNKYDLSLDEIAVSVPSQNSFARFVNLPPVEAKRVPEMVKFEAAQQIPFDINDIQWDWQLMSEPDSAEMKVGIFAIKNEVVDSALEHFNREDVQASYVQMAPMALYNYLLHDRPDLVTSDTQATVVLNVGAEITDLVVCTRSAVWQRCITIGGNAFTRAIADTFRLNFEKAEKLKRTAPVSKYARQIFQAMRPVFTDLASEVQRSLGFYNSSNPNTKIVKIVALGGGTRLRGLLKYMQQTLQLPVERPDSFKRVGMGPGVSPAKFHENVCDFGVVYGLALQGLGLARIESNLLPKNIARSMAWASKGRYFIAAACMILVVGLLSLGRVGLDRMNYNKNGPTRLKSTRVVSTLQDAKDQSEDVQNLGLDYDAKIEKEFEPFKHREVIARLYETLLSHLPNKTYHPDQADLYDALAGGDVQKVMQIPRNQRKQIFVTSMTAYFTYDLAAGQFGAADMWRKSRGLPGGDMEGEMDEYEYAMMMEEEFGYGMEEYGIPGMFGAQTAEEKVSGFVVTLVGYSPYGNNVAELATLIDPHGVEDQQDKWGYVTRLAHLDDFVEDGNSPFELYEKGVQEQFGFEPKKVVIEEQMPGGIGVQEVRYNTASGAPEPGDPGVWVLVDPLTKEIMNEVNVLDEKGEPVYYQGKEVKKVHDHWFVLNLKFKWRDAPEAPAPAVPAYPGAMMR
ncbi:MAG: type IV pilus assembly protein PilM, partial [Planctomycetota bacterium]